MEEDMVRNMAGPRQPAGRYGPAQDIIPRGQAILLLALAAWLAAILAAAGIWHCVARVLFWFSA